MSPWGWLLFCTIASFSALLVVAAAVGLWDSIKKKRED